MHCLETGKQLERSRTYFWGLEIYSRKWSKGRTSKGLWWHTTSLAYSRNLLSDWTPEECHSGPDSTWPSPKTRTPATTNKTNPSQEARFSGLQKTNQDQARPQPAHINAPLYRQVSGKRAGGIRKRLRKSRKNKITGDIGREEPDQRHRGVSWSGLRYSIF